MRCSICIATYKRPKLLEKLLISLSNQQVPENWEKEIVIVDNDAHETARPVFERFANNSQNIKYFVQPVKNISLTRNKAVKNASGDYLVFIDDDEHAEPNWLKNLIETIENYKADVVIGKILSEYPPDTPEWVKSVFIFNRPASPTGEEPFYTYTGNCIIKRSAIEKFQGPFDISYGLSGGEDTHLFTRIRRNGGKIISCYEAVTYEFVPKERTKFSWQFKRAFRLGNNYCRRYIEFSNKSKIITSSKCALQSLLYAIISLILSIFTLPFKKERVHWILKVSANLGKFIAVFGHQSKEYKKKKNDKTFVTDNAEFSV